MKNLDSYTQTVHKSTNPFLVASGCAFAFPAEKSAVDYIGSTATAVTMTSQEIADLVGSRHDNVKIAIERLADRKVIQRPAMQEVKNANGQSVRQYVFSGEKGKRDSIIAVAQLSPEFTAALVDRWQELEAEKATPAFAVPTTFHGALMLAAELEERRAVLTYQVEAQIQKIAEDAPKVKVYDDIANSTGVIGFQEFCTQLHLKQREVKIWMRDIGWLRLNRYQINPLPTAKAVDDGYCEVRDYTTPGGKFTQSIKFTGKAITYASEHAPSHIRKEVRN